MVLAAVDSAQAAAVSGSSTAIGAGSLLCPPVIHSQPVLLPAGAAAACCLRALLLSAERIRMLEFAGAGASAGLRLLRAGGGGGGGSVMTSWWDQTDLAGLLSLKSPSVSQRWLVKLYTVTPHPPALLKRWVTNGSGRSSSWTEWT